MKVGNTINGLKVTDVKRVNKLNLIQFLKEVDSYLQKGYQIDVNSGRQVGLVLMADVYKTEQPFGSVESTDVDSVGDVDSTDVSSTDANSNGVGSVGEQIPTESVGVDSKEDEPAPEQQSVQSTNVEDAVEPVEAVVKEEAPVAPKKTTTRSKKTVQ